MRHQEIIEACWTGYKQQGMKDKGGRQVPNCVPVKEATDIFLDNAAREIMAVLFTMGAGLSYGIYLKIRNKLDKYQGYQIVAALENKGVTMNRNTYQKVQPVLDQFRQALRDNNGEQAKELAKRIEQMIVMGKLSAPEPQAQDTALAAKERELAEDLKKWFKEKWVRFGPDGKIRGDCARGSSSEGKPKCLPQSKAQALGKKGRAASAAKKRREDPNPERRGAAKNVATKVKENDWNDSDDYENEENNLRSGDYVRDRQDGEYGEIFRMQGDPEERRVRILDRDGRGWYIEPSRLVVVDRNDPDVQRYFGKQRQRDMDKADVAETVTDVRAGMAEIYHRLAPKIERHRDSFLAGQLYDELENYAELHGAEGEFKRIMNGARNRAHMDYDTNPGGFQNWLWYLPFADEQLDEKQDACYSKVKSRYKVWPSAYASGALVQCRKKGAANWGNKGKK